MNKKDIETRADIYFLVTTFYEKVKNDAELGPFFSHIVHWDEHLEQITTFWESSLFLKTKYLGNPLKAHVQLDNDFQNSIKQEHFGFWLNLWYQTIDDLYEGEMASRAKNRARKMSTFLYLNIFEARTR